MGATGDISLKVMIFLTGLIMIAVLVALESPGIHSIYSGISSGVSKSGVSLIIDKLNDAYDKYYLWSVSHGGEGGSDSFDYSTQFNVILSPGIYLLYPDSSGYYRLDYYSEANVDIYQLSTTTVDSAEKFRQFIGNGELVDSEYVGFKYSDFTIQGLCPVSKDVTRVMVIIVDKVGSQVGVTLKSVKVSSDDCNGEGSKSQLLFYVSGADSVIVRMSYSALESQGG